MTENIRKTEQSKTFEGKPLYPLTHAQKRIWYTEYIYENPVISNISMSIKYDEILDFELLNEALNIVVYKNDGLRLKMIKNSTNSDSKLMQYVSDYNERKFDFFDFSNEKDDNGLNDWLKKEASEPFDTINNELFYFAMFKYNDSESGYFIKTHHIVSDGWTVQMLKNEIYKIYSALKAGEKPDKSKNPSYIDYIEIEEEFINSDDYEKSRKHWIDKLIPLPDEVKLQFGGNKSKTQNASSIKLNISSNIRSQIMDYCKNNHTSIFNVIMTAFSIYISKINQKNKICLTSVSHNRSSKKEKNMTGMFVSSFPLLIDVSDDMSFKTLNQLTRKELINVLKNHSKYPFDQILAELKTKTGSNPNYLMDFSIIGHPDYVEECNTKYIFSGQEASSLGIHINAENKNLKGELGLTFNFQDDIFTKNEIENLFLSLETILGTCMDNPEILKKDIQLVSESQKQKLLFDFNNTRADFPYRKTLHELFEEQVAKTPDKVALVFKEKRLSYIDLNKKANQLARHLKDRKIERDQIVALIADRSIEFIIGVLAILKAGGAYAPVDPEYPSERIKYILENSNASLLLCRTNKFEFPEFNGQIIDLENSNIFSGDDSNPKSCNSPRDLAYVIYTSGSTGKPKGVMIEHRSIINYIKWHINKYKITDKYRCAAHASFSFDASIPQIYSPLLSGAQLHIIDSDIRLSPIELNEYFEKNQIDHADLPTQFAEQFMNIIENKSLKSITTGGEKLTDYKLSDYRLIDEYGPTEYTVSTTSFEIDKKYAKTPIGKPINNTRVYILDKNNNLQPQNIPGELCISGIGLARGYLNNKDLTEEKFIDDPFFEGERMYKTGDLARWLPEGNIDFFGRKDFQVKIRGFRVEPGEIENTLKENELIKNAIVIGSKDENKKDFLSAHIVLENNFIENKGQNLRVVTVAQDPALEGRMETEHIGSWPVFFIGDKINVKYWKKLYEVFPDYQFAVMGDEDTLLTLGNTIPLYWNGKNKDLPTGWDDAVVRGFRDYENNVKPNTVCALAGVVSKKARGRGFSFEAIKVMCKLVLANGLERFILPVRPTRKADFEEMTLEEYIVRKKEDGTPEDPWVGVHQILGGELIGYCHHSQLIEGSVKQWEEWAERKFEKSGSYKVKGAMQPVEIDIENNKGTYHDLAIWIEHNPLNHIEPPINTLNTKRVKDFLGKHIPSYMIPSRYSFVNEIPLTVNGKIDKDALLKTLPQGEIKTDFIEPETEMEKTLSVIWSEILEVEKVGITDNFFELGGHSLKAITLQSAIQKNFEVKFKVQSIFKYPTIKEQASLIKAETKFKYPVVEQIDEKNHYSLSSAQKRLYIMEQMNDMGSTYNMPIAIKISGSLDTKKLSDSLSAMIERHQSLRTSFKMMGGEPAQVIHKKVKLKKLFEEVQEENINQAIAEFVSPFDLEKAPLMRVKFFKINHLTYVLVMDFHHIIMDGISLSTFMGELWGMYNDKKLPELSFQYKDFIDWQQKVFKSSIIAEQEKYWMDSFKNEIPVLDLITDYPRSASADYEGDHLDVFLDKINIDKLKMVAQNTGTTLFTIYLAALNVLLSRYTLQDDIVVGIPSSGRTTEEFENTIGMFVNTLAIRSFPNREKTFRDYLFEVKEIMLNALDNQDYQFDKLVEKVVSNRDVSRNPLFDVMFAYQGEYSYKVGEKIPLDISPIPYEPKISKFDLSILAFNRENDMMFSLEYKTSLFDRRTISSFGEHFINILTEIGENCDLKTGDYVILSEQEKKKNIIDFNETTMHYPLDKSMVQLFEDQVERTPDFIALINNNDSLTYSELNRKSNMFAWKLIENSNSKSKLIGISLDRSIDFMVAVLGVLKAGFAYLPIDPTYPPERLKSIIQESKIDTIITSSDNLMGIDDFTGRIINIQDKSVYGSQTENLKNTHTVNDPAYVIFTSGSTGKPKGVVVPHKGVTNYLWWGKNVYLDNKPLDFALHSSISFDLTVTSLFLPLISGSKIYIYNNENSTELIMDIINDDKVGIIKLTPAHLQLIKEIDFTPTNLKRLIVGGEELKTELARAIFEKFGRKIKIFNEYGPTEATVGCMAHLFTPDDAKHASVPIGIPADNTQIYLLDSVLNPVPAGAKGEIYISGDGVAQGYLGRSDLTSQQFVNNPFDVEKKLYKTGDLARFLADGNVQFLGRVDEQVKIRGFRIEPAEIEAQLISHKDISKAVVILKTDKNNEKVLCAYFVSSKKINGNDLRAHLLKKLPAYFVPSLFVNIDSIPLTVNGKIDKKALPEPFDKAIESSEYAPPENEKQEKLCKYWEKILGLERIGIDDNFFASGGHSLKAVQLVSCLQDEFEVSINDIFKFQTIRELGEKIKPVKDFMRYRIKTIKANLQKQFIESEAKPNKEMVDNEKKYKNSLESIKNIDFTLRKQYKNILLTGATGYLGVYLLNELIKGDNVKVHLLVRGSNNKEAVRRISDKYDYYFGEGSFSKARSSVDVINGDITKENLSIEKDVYEELTGKIDCIIHSAANVKHFGTYEESYKTNVEGTINLLKFAETGSKKDFNHISTLSVGMGYIENTSEVLFTEDDCDLGQTVDNVYIRSKFEAEKAVIAARERGLQTNIFRVGNIVYESTGTVLQENIEENAFFNILSSFINLGYIPEDCGEFELSYVDYLSKAILSIFNISKLQNQIYHIKNNHTVDIEKLLTNKKLGLNILTLSNMDFLDLLFSIHNNNYVRRYIENIMLHMGWMEEESTKTTVFNTVCDRTSFILKKTGFCWPDTVSDTLDILVLKSLAPRMALISKISVFNNLKSEELFMIAKSSRNELFDEGNYILSENEMNNKVHIMLDGFVELNKHSKSGWLGTISLASKDELLGLNSIFSNAPSTISAEVYSDNANSLSIDGENIRKIISRNAELSNRIIEKLLKNIDGLESLIVNIG